MDRLNKKGLLIIGLFMVLPLFDLKIKMFAQHITVDSEVRMLALGDSYTIGESVEMNQRWPHQFVADLRKLGKDACPPYYIATTGWTTADLLEGIAGTLRSDKEYNLVSILIGVNNQYQGIDIISYEPELRKIIEHALEITGQLSSRIFMLSIPDYAYTPFGKGDTAISREIDTYNEINRKLALEYDIAWFDITAISRRGLNEPSLVAGDDLHPSAAQYRLWVDKLIHHPE